MPSAISFEVQGDRPEDILEPFQKAAFQLDGLIGGGIVFLSGTMARQIHEVTTLLKNLHLKTHLLVVSGSGVFTERGFYEQKSAGVGLLWKDGQCTPITVNQRGNALIAPRLAKVIHQTAGLDNPVALFASREALNPLRLFDENKPIEQPLFGGGALGNPGAMIVTSRKVISADVVGLAIHGAGRGIVRASPACQLLGSPVPVTKMDGALLMTVGGEPALEVLKKQALNIANQRPVVLAVDLGHDNPARTHWMIRSIRGIHQDRDAVMVSEDIREGNRVAFAVIDPKAAATNRELTLREMSRDLHGGLPRFGIFIDWLGKDTQVFADPKEDLRALHRRFPKLPIIGLTSAFEMGPGRTGAEIHLFSEVFCLVYSPS